MRFMGMMEVTYIVIIFIMAIRERENIELLPMPKLPFIYKVTFYLLEIVMKSSSSVEKNIISAEKAQ